MTLFQLHSFRSSSPAGEHTLYYKDWGDTANPRVLLCIHGLVRASDDFDFLAQELSKTYRVICPDIVGRGRSDRLIDPQHYQVQQYVKDLHALLEHLELKSVDVLGTSLGGVIGMVLASLPDVTVGRLILNDVSPQLHAEGMRALGKHIAQGLQFATFEEGVAYVKKISAGLGPHDEDQWRTLAQNALRQSEVGDWYFHYDPALSVPLLTATEESARQGEQALWQLYDGLACRVLLIRGQESTLLNKDVAEAMTQRGPRADLVEIAGVGHAPTFLHLEQIIPVRDFLQEQIR